MKKNDKPKKEQKPRAPAKRKGVTELSEQELDKVQGGSGGGSGAGKIDIIMGG